MATNELPVMRICLFFFISGTHQVNPIKSCDEKKALAECGEWGWGAELSFS